MKRELWIQDDKRAEGRHSLYVRNGGMGWYTGLTFSNLRDAEKVARVIRKLWVGDGE